MSSLRDSVSGNNPTIKDFVLQEAHERAFQIGVLALKDYEKEKSRILHQRKEAQLAQFDKRHKETEAANRIHKSSLINDSRMKKMKARHADLLKIIAESELRLKEKTANSAEYKKLLKDLIVQGLIKMLQPVVFVRCLQKDANLVKSIIEQSKAQFRQIIAKEGVDESVGRVDLRLDERFFLQERKIAEGIEDKTTKAQQNTKCFGGVILTSEDGLIVCKNTLDSRVELAYQQMLPIIRTTLFS